MAAVVPLHKEEGRKLNILLLFRAVYPQFLHPPYASSPIPFWGIYMWCHFVAEEIYTSKKLMVTVLMILGKSKAEALLTDRLLYCIITLFTHTLNQPYVRVPNIHFLLIHQELCIHSGCKDSPSERPLIKKSHEQVLIELPKLFLFLFIYALH